MKHETLIDKPPTGKKVLKFRGATPSGDTREIAVSKDTSLKDAKASGSCNAIDAKIKVSERRFDELKVQPLPFNLVINASSSGVVSSCTIQPVQQNAA